MLDPANGHGAPPARIHGHLVAFYDHAGELTSSAIEFLLPALTGAGAAVVVATAEHREQFAGALAVAGVDIDAMKVRGRLVVLDAADTLATFMSDGGMPDPGRFHEVIGGLIAEVSTGHDDVRVYGEMVALLWSAGNADGAIAVEELWNDLAASTRFSLLCGYPMKALHRSTGSESFLAVCREHSAIIPNEGFAAGANWSDQLSALLRAAPEADVASDDLHRIRGEFISMVVDNLRTGLLRRGDDLIAEARRTLAEIDQTLPGTAPIATPRRAG